ALMASMASRMAIMSVLPASAAERVSLVRFFAVAAPSALRRVIELSSSMEEQVSSRLAAGSLEPSARVWLLAETWPAAEETLSEASPRDDAISESGRAREREKKNASVSEEPMRARLPQSVTLRRVRLEASLS